MSRRKENWRPLAEAALFAKANKIKSHSEWNKFCDRGCRPHNIPRNLNLVYGKEFNAKTFFYQLGEKEVVITNKNEAKAPLRQGRTKRVYAPYEEAKALAARYNIKTHTQWRDLSRNGLRPDNIPANPDTYYIGKGWKNWDDFYSRNEGTGEINKKHAPLEMEKEIVPVRTIKEGDWARKKSSINKTFRKIDKIVGTVAVFQNGKSAELDELELLQDTAILEKLQPEPKDIKRVTIEKKTPDEELRKRITNRFRNIISIVPENWYMVNDSSGQSYRKIKSVDPDSNVALISESISYGTYEKYEDGGEHKFFGLDRLIPLKNQAVVDKYIPKAKETLKAFDFEALRQHLAEVSAKIWKERDENIAKMHSALANKEMDLSNTVQELSVAEVMKTIGKDYISKAYPGVRIGLIFSLLNGNLIMTLVYNGRAISADVKFYDDIVPIIETLYSQIKQK